MQIQFYSLSSFFALLPLSCWVLPGSIYSFPVVRFSAGFLQDHLCLEVYSWCIRGERFTPRAPTLPLSWISVYGIEPTPHSKSGLLWSVVKFLLLGWDKKQWISCSHLNILLSWSFFWNLCVDMLISFASFWKTLWHYLSKNNSGSLPVPPLQDDCDHSFHHFLWSHYSFPYFLLFSS